MYPDRPRRTLEIPIMGTATVRHRAGDDPGQVRDAAESILEGLSCSPTDEGIDLILDVDRTVPAEVVLSRVLARCGFAVGHETTEDEAAAAIRQALPPPPPPRRRTRWKNSTAREIWIRAVLAATPDDGSDPFEFADHVLAEARKRFGA